MLFSEKNWHNAEEINRFIPVSSALSFDKVESSLRDAEDMFVRPLFGNRMMKQLHKLYNGSAEALSDEEAMLLHMVKNAIANLAFWYNFTELNIRITDQGFQRQTTDDFAQTYKYQEMDLQHRFKSKGFKALDSAIDFCMQNIDDFKQFKDSDAYKQRSTALVKSISEANEIYGISHSSLIWLSLYPIIKEIEDTILVEVLGMRLHTALMSALENKTEKIEDCDTEKIRTRCAKYVVTLAISLFIKRGGSLTDRGLYFEKINATSESGLSMAPADYENRAKLSNEMFLIAQRYRNQLLMFCKQFVPEHFGGLVSEVLNRDNDHHKAVFL